MAGLPPPPWYRIYPRFASILFLTAVTLRLAAGVRIAAREVRATESQQEKQELIKFEEVHPVEEVDSSNGREGDLRQ